MCTLVHTYIILYIVTVSSTLRTSFAECIAERGKTRRPIRYSVFRHACGSPRLKQRRPPTATFSNNNAVSFLYQSTQHFDIGPYKPTFRKHRSNIGSHIYVACFIATFILFPIYHSRPIESASCRPPSLWLSLLHSIYHSVAKFFFNLSMPDYRDNQCYESLLHAIHSICVFVFV